MKTYLKLSHSLLGDLTAIMFLVGFVSMTLWGSVADYTGNHKLVLGSLSIASGLVFLTFSILKRVDNIVLTILGLALYSLCVNGLQPLTDFEALKILGEHHGNLYSRQKLWETVACAFTSYLLAMLIQSIGIHVMLWWIPISATAFAVIIYLFAPSDFKKQIHQEPNHIHTHEPTTVITTTTTTTITTGDDKLIEITEKQTQEQKVKKRPFYHLFKVPNFLFLIIIVFLIGIARMTMSIFFSFFLQDRVGFSLKRIGEVSITAYIPEVTIFILGPQISTLLGPNKLLLIAQIAMVVRAWFYVWLPVENPYITQMIFAIELLKGVAFGCTTCAGVKMASQSAPPGMEATAQAIYTGMYSQLPAVLGSCIGGRIYQYRGPSELFFMMAISCTTALVLFIVKLILFK